MIRAILLHTYYSIISPYSVHIFIWSTSQSSILKCIKICIHCNNQTFLYHHRYLSKVSSIASCIESIKLLWKIQTLHLIHFVSLALINVGSSCIPLLILRKLGSWDSKEPTSKMMEIPLVIIVWTYKYRSDIQAFASRSCKVQTSNKYSPRKSL